MPDTYSDAAEPLKIGRELIKKYHDHLSGRRVDFLFVERKDKDGNSQAITKRGKNLYGQAKLILSGEATNEGPEPFFVILITKHFWTNASDLFKQALVDHELCRCEYDSTTDKYSTVDHDVTEFTQIVKRWGLWNWEVEAFVKAAKQQSLAFESEPPPPEPANPPAARTPKVRRIKSKTDAVTALGG